MEPLTDWEGGEESREMGVLVRQIEWIDYSDRTNEQLQTIARRDVHSLVSVVREYCRRGLNDSEISEETLLPRATVYNWRKRYHLEACPNGQLSDNKLAVDDGQYLAGIQHCSMQELFDGGVAPDVVITDPPYPGEFLPLFSELASRCQSVPVVAVMSGQYHLPEVLNRLCEHLRYRWTLAYLTPGPKTQLFHANVHTSWKPVLLFGESRDWLPNDVATSPVPDKDHHEWGQSNQGMADLISLLSKPGNLVCDPFLGGGTTAVEAIRAGRRFVGCDVDLECVELTKRRCMEVVNERGENGSEVSGDIEAAQDVGPSASGLGY